MNWKFNDLFDPVLNDTCKTYNDENCYCYHMSDNNDFKAFCVIFVYSFFGYLLWAGFVMSLQCEKRLNCIGCKILFTKTQDVPQDESHDPLISSEGNFHQNPSEEDVEQNPSNRNVPQNTSNENFPQKKKKKALHFCVIAFMFFGWILFLTVIVPFHHKFLRWRYFHFWTSVFSLIFSLCYFLWSENKLFDDLSWYEWAQKKVIYFWPHIVNCLIIFGLIMLGFSQIIFNLPHVPQPITPKLHAKRLISTEYTFFVFMCFLFSLFSSVFVKKNQNPNSLNYSVSFLTQQNFIMCLRIFTFVWPTSIIRDFLHLLIDYDEKWIFFIFQQLTWEEKKHLAFNSAFVILSFVISCFSLFTSYYTHWVHSTVAYVAFIHVINFCRMTIIYKEFSWLLSDIAEVMSGNVFIFAGIWYLFYLTEDQKEVHRFRTKSVQTELDVRDESQQTETGTISISEQPPLSASF